MSLHMSWTPGWQTFPHALGVRPTAAAGHNHVPAFVGPYRGPVPDVQPPGGEYEYHDPCCLQSRQDKEVVVQMAGLAVDVAAVVAEEPRVSERLDGDRAQEGADALTEPEQSHDDALHGARGFNVRQF